MLRDRPTALRGVLLAVATAVITAIVPATGTATAATAPTAGPDIPASPGTSAFSETWQPSSQAGGSPLASNQAQPKEVIAVLSGSTAISGTPLPGGARFPLTTNLAVNSAFTRLGAVSVQPLFGQLPADQVQQLTNSARSRLGADAPDLSKVVLVTLRGGDPAAAAATLSATPGVTFAEPNRFVSTMNTAATPMPSWAAAVPTPQPPPSPHGAPPNPQGALPTNYGLTSSMSAFLNAGGVNAMGAYSELQRHYGQLPGAGQVITNVSIGDLTDQSMAAAGDPYVQRFGPTTIVENGQRYLDLPSMPLIPTYTSGPSGTLNPTGTTTNQDPTLGEVMLDFGVMSPLPHNLQRPNALGSGATDLLGIAPGAQYRLVVPQQPTFDQIAVALLAAARQSPQPNVISASLGFGTDAFGFPGRYLEDDPVLQAVIAAIVQQYHIVVSIAANDGTRLFTPAAVGADGGSTPTNVTRNPSATTNIGDDAYSTTPSQVLDSGAIAAGGTTLDDTLAVPPRTGGPQSSNPTFAATRTNGSGLFSSGFGTRINVSAPSDGIASFTHPQGGSAQSVSSVFSGGTSASAPEVAAAAAIVLQAAALTGQSLNPDQVRSLLQTTGRAVATPPQIAQPLQVGNQLDVTAAVNAVLANGDSGSTGNSHAAQGQSAPQIVRLSVAHRQTIGNLGGKFTEATDPSMIDLAGPNGTGEGLVGPVTIGADVAGLSPDTHPRYVLRVGSHTFTSDVPAIRLTPTQLLQAAGLPVVSSTNRSLTLTFEVRQGAHVVASAAKQLTFGPTDGTFAEALAPVAPAQVAVGHSVTVHYDLTGVRNVAQPQLVVSTVGHWNPGLAPVFTAAYSIALTATSGTVTVPASAFGGGGIYGIGINQNSTRKPPYGRPIYGEFASIGVTGAPATARPAAPTLAAGGSAQFGHFAQINRGAPAFSLRYDVRNVPAAAGAAVEVSAPAPTWFNSLNTVTNANGTTRDHNGVDTGSVAYQRLPSAAGTASFNAPTLGLGDALNYSVRVFATDRNGNILGQASPTSMLTFDNGLVPGGGSIASFAVQPGGESLAAVRSPTGGEAVRVYQPATGTYGQVLAFDPDSTSGYTVIGVDPTAHRALLLHWSATGWTLETYDTTTNTQVAAIGAAADYTVLGGRVDPVRHRAAILVHRKSDNADVVLPVDLTTGALRTPIVADTPGMWAGNYSLIDIDPTTGTVYLAHLATPFVCFAGGIGMLASVNLDAGTVTPSPSSDGCAVALAAEGGRNTVYQASYRTFSANIAGTANLIPSAGDTLQSGTAMAVRKQFPLALAVDPVHQLALVAFETPQATNGAISDNNATGQIAVVDLKTGATVSVIPGFGFTATMRSMEYNKKTQQPIQLDPATRTGWTFSADDQQLQQFHY